MRIPLNEAKAPTQQIFESKRHGAEIQRLTKALSDGACSSQG